MGSNMESTIVKTLIIKNNILEPIDKDLVRNLVTWWDVLGEKDEEISEPQRHKVIWFVRKSTINRGWINTGHLEWIQLYENTYNR